VHEGSPDGSEEWRRAPRTSAPLDAAATIRQPAMRCRGFYLWQTAAAKIKNSMIFSFAAVEALELYV
jgi:hypothetical protein